MPHTESTAMLTATTRRSRVACPHAAARLLLAAAVAAVSLAAFPDAAAGQCQYEVTAIIEGPPVCSFGSDALIFPQDINDGGTVIGYWRCPTSTAERAFRWDEGSGLEMLMLPVAGVYSWRASGINSHGDVCGWYIVAGDDPYQAGFVLTAEGEFISIPVPDGGTHLEAHAINDSGQVCGWWKGVVDGALIGGAFRWENGELLTIPPPEDYDNIRGYDLNAAGQITGWAVTGPPAVHHAFIWDGEAVTVLPPIPGGITSEGDAINATTQVAGEGSMGGGIDHAYVATEDLAQDLGGIVDFVESWAWDIHDNGLVVGKCAFTETNVGPGCLWHHSAAYDLNTLLVGNPPTINLAYAINPSGQIAASTAGAQGALLTPVDPPPADITGDCRVDVVDLLKLLEHWSAEDSFADLDDSGVVAVGDLLLLLGDWTG